MWGKLTVKHSNKRVRGGEEKIKRKGNHTYSFGVGGGTSERENMNQKI